MFSFIYIMVYYLWTFFSSMMCIIYSSQYYFLLLWGCWTCRGGWACERKMFFFFKVWNVSLSWVCIISTFFYCIGGTKVTYLANVSYLHFSTAYSRYFIFFLTNIDTNASISPIFIQFSDTKWLCDILTPLFHNMQIWLSFNSIVVVW